jgi:hypothetical protein
MALDVRCQCSGSVAVTWAVGCGDECPKSQIVIEFGIARAFRRTRTTPLRYSVVGTSGFSYRSMLGQRIENETHIFTVL